MFDEMKAQVQFPFRRLSEYTVKAYIPAPAANTGMTADYLNTA